MPYAYYIPPEQITNSMFRIRVGRDHQFLLDTYLTVLDNMTFNELLILSKKVKVFARRRYSKQSMIEGIRRNITFEPPDEETEYVYIMNNP